LVEVVLDKGISERELAGDERPWTTLQNIRQVKSYRFLLTLNIVINPMLAVTSKNGRQQLVRDIFHSDLL